MPIFTVGLSRTYLVKVEAQNLEDAVKATDFVGLLDESWELERDELGFHIIEVEMVDNDVFNAS